MKKFTQAIVAVHEAESAGKSELQKSYQDYFAAKLNKYGVKSPAELDADKKSQFFSEISKDWERGQGATEAGKADVEKHGVKESEVNKNNSDTVRESEVVLDLKVNEADVKSEADFKEYAQNILKKAHKDDYDEKKADATINGILKKADGDYGKAVGILNNSLG